MKKHGQTSKQRKLTTKIDIATMNPNLSITWLDVDAKGWELFCDKIKPKLANVAFNKMEPPHKLLPSVARHPEIDVSTRLKGVYVRRNDRPIAIQINHVTMA